MAAPTIAWEYMYEFMCNTETNGKVTPSIKCYQYYQNDRVCDHLIEVGGGGRGGCGAVVVAYVYVHALHSLKMTLRKPPIPHAIGTEERSGFWGAVIYLFIVNEGILAILT